MIFENQHLGTENNWFDHSLDNSVSEELWCSDRRQKGIGLTVVTSSGRLNLCHQEGWTVEQNVISRIKYKEEEHSSSVIHCTECRVLLLYLYSTRNNNNEVKFETDSVVTVGSQPIIGI
jgi:hypothetical protein